MQDATSLAAAIAAGQVSAPEVMAAALRAAERHADLDALAQVDAAHGLAAAAQPRNGPFGGVPFLGKDLGSGAAGFPPCAGSEALRRRATSAGSDSLLFERFRTAGLLPFGLSRVPEFGLALTSDPARNPFNTEFSPGGSSGGAAAAVAAGIVAMAHATDAAGSIRVPAACCGLVGLKPSRGAIPGGPDFGNHLMGLASELVLARSVRDVATAFAVAAGHARGPCGDPAPMRLAEQPRVALCVPRRCGTAQARAAEAAAAALRKLGCPVTLLGAPDELGARAARIARLILTASLAEWMDALNIPGAELSPLAAAVADEGRTLTAASLFAASREMAQVSFALWQAFDDCDVILSPVLAGGPPRIGAFDMTGTSPESHFAQMEATAPNAALANVAGAPALAFPFGSDEQGLPVGLQLMGPIGSDAALLGLAARLEAMAAPVAFPFPIAGHP
jgi:amidase